MLIIRFLETTLGFGVAMLLGSGSALADLNSEGVSPYDAFPESLRENRGNIMCTGAINSDGTIASKGLVLRSTWLGTGAHEVVFRVPCRDITAANGWSRIVRPDTLTIGSTLGPRTCTTADRAGNVNAVFVACYDETGAFADTSFFIFVLR